MAHFDNKIEPLVSVVVITYNSAKTVIETLESIRSQTYRNLELIISDDCSTDDTIVIVNEWLKGNDTQFVYSELLTTDKNTGVSGNLNRGVLRSHGEWIKSIAGDDLLVPEAIDEYVKFVKNHADKVKMCISDVELFSTDGLIPGALKRDYSHFFEMANESYEEQRIRVMSQLVFVGPSYYYSRELFDEVGGFSEEYGCAEEWPFVYKVICGGNRIYAIDKKLIKYRFSQKSLSHNKNNKGVRNIALDLSSCKFFFDYPFHDLLRSHHYLIAWDRYLFFRTCQVYYESKEALWAFGLMKLSSLLSPYAYLNRLKIIKKMI